MPRNSFLLVLLFVLCSFTALAQHPLIGTWEMASIAGVNADGEKFKFDSATIRETKIITPTHYILIASDKEDGTWKFNRCYFGSTKIEGGKYYEFPIMSSETIYENLKTDFNWKVDGNDFVQSGLITRPDGKTIVLDRFLFRRSKASPVSDKKFVGTWQAESAGVKSYLVVTSTHWMVVIKKDQKFSKAMGGVYKINGNVAALGVSFGTENAGTIYAEIKGQQISLDNLSYSKVK